MEADLVCWVAIHLGFESSRVHDSLAVLPWSGFIDFLGLGLLDNTVVAERMS